MKKFITLFLMLTSTVVLAQDKKELKKISKVHNETVQGKPLSKNKSVAILGTNLRFRVAARATGATSNRADVQAKFESFSVLDSVSESLLQEITDEYYTMIEDRFLKLGYTVMGIDEIKKAKSFPKLAEKCIKEKENVLKSWGVAKIFTPKGADFYSWMGMVFGPHMKVAKEMKSLLFNSLTTVDFCMMDVDASTSGGGYKTTYVNGSAKIIPAVSIHGYSYPLNGLKIYEDATYTMALGPDGKQHSTMYKGTIVSKVDYATKTESCSSCKPDFARKANLVAHGLGTVVVTADPVKFKAAVLDALTQYLDQVFMLYTAQKK